MNIPKGGAISDTNLVKPELPVHLVILIVMAIAKNPISKQFARPRIMPPKSAEFRNSGLERLLITITTFFRW